MKNRQYYKSKKRVLKYKHVDTDKVISTIRIATELVMSAIQLQIQLSTPRPKYESGGSANTSQKGFNQLPETGPELVVGKNGEIRSFAVNPYEGHTVTLLPPDEVAKLEVSAFPELKFKNGEFEK